LNLSIKGLALYEACVHEKLKTQEKLNSVTVKQNKIPLFSRPVLKTTSKQKLEL